MTGDTYDLDLDLDQYVSRHATEGTYAAWAGPEDIATARSYLALADRIGRQGTPRSGEARRKPLSRVGRIVGTDEYVIAERGVVEAPLTIEPAEVTSTRFKKRTLHGARFLDAFFDREDGGPWFTARDRDVFEALLEWATVVRPSQESLNLANHAVCLGVLARAGIVMHPSDLPGWPQ